MFGKPVITGTPIHVELILKLLGNGRSIETLLEAKPRSTRGTIQAAQAFTAEHLPRAKPQAAE